MCQRVSLVLFVSLYRVTGKGKETSPLQSLGVGTNEALVDLSDSPGALLTKSVLFSRKKPTALSVGVRKCFRMAEIANFIFWSFGEDGNLKTVAFKSCLKNLALRGRPVSSPRSCS